MRIEAITIENFKGIREPVRIEFRPVTLLFGPNSAGKSTIVQALHYAHEIIARNNVDPGRTLRGGQAIELGGFESLVNEHDKSLPIRLSFDLDLRMAVLPQFRETRLFFGAVKDYEWSSVNTVRVTLTATWSGLLNKAILQQYDVDINNEHLASIRMSSDGKLVGLEPLRIGHSLLRSSDDDTQPSLFGYYDIAESILAKEYLRDVDSVSLPVAQATTLPDPQRSLTFDESIWRSDASRDACLGFVDTISTLVVGPLNMLADQLNRLCYLGPLREVPPRNFEAALSPDEARWAHGLAAWDILSSATPTFLSEVNEWLTRPDRFNAEYAIVIREYKEVGANLAATLASNPQAILDQDRALLENLLGQPVKRQLTILDERKNLTVLPHDVGIGISQMIPVVVAALFQKEGIVSIEQPELHIHPAWQVVLGDLFLSQAKNTEKSFLIETHSEHLLLRMLRRIRETNDDEVPPGAPAAVPDDVAVYFVEAGDTGTTAKRLRVDRTGEFIDRWPRGFFDERAEELF